MYTFIVNADLQLQQVVRLEDYSITQTSLDDVFVAFANSSSLDTPSESANASLPSIDLQLAATKPT